MRAEFDNDREWIQWWIEDEELWRDEDSWQRQNVPGYREYRFPRGVIEFDLSPQ